MNRPEFNDVFEKAKIRAHKTFGGKVVEILYGATDAEGNPTAPEAGAEDGHGCWSGIECNGNYQMFVWKHSAAEGGNTEYGTSHGEHALEDMEAQLATKIDLCRKIEEATRNYDDTTEAAVEALKAEWAALENWNTPKDAEYQARFDKALATYEPRKAALTENKNAKEAVLAKVEAIKNEVNFNNARKALDALRAELQEIGSAGEEADDAFWKRFNEVRNDLRTRQKQYFKDLDANRETAKEKKEELIAKANELLESGAANWKNASDKLNAIFDEWKSAGSAGHESDEDLWGKFSAVRQEFFAKRKAFFSERSAQWKTSIEAKKNLIEEAKKIAGTGIFSKENTERMKALDKEWKTAGYSGKDNNDKLWNEFSVAKEAFWEAKKSIATKRIQDQIDAKEDAITAAKKAIEDLEYRITIAPNPNMKDDIERSIYLKKSEINDLEDEIEELQAKLD